MRGNSTPITVRNRQIVYAVAILVLFSAMLPYTIWLEGEKEKRDLGEATIGQIDTGSFMLKLALLGGARGVAANVLWLRATKLQKVHEWDQLEQTVNMITKLQPHFLSVWTFQSWNLAYNVSVEWDDPADKYEWIKRGIEFVKDGVDKNRKSPDLLWDTAFYYYHKLGMSDEAIILRKLLHEDEDEEFKTDPIELMDHGIKVTRNDNFQLSWGWFTRAVRLVDQGASRVQGGVGDEAVDVEYVDAPIQHKGRPDDLAFRSMPAHSLTRYAAALEKASVRDYPATFGDFAQKAWRDAEAEWRTFGEHEWESPNVIEVNGKPIHHYIHIGDISYPERVAKMPENQAYWTDRWAQQMNYPYWLDRCSAESEPIGVSSRRLFYEAFIALKTADFRTAVTKYREGLRYWQDLLERHPIYRNDDLNQKDTGQVVRRYVLALRQLGQEVPEDLPFRDLWEAAEKAPRTVDPFDDLEVRRSVSKALVPAGGGAGGGNE